MQSFLKILTAFIFSMGVVYANDSGQNVDADGISDTDAKKVLEKNDTKNDGVVDNTSALDTVEQYEGEAVVGGSVYDVGQTILNTTGISKVKIPFFDKIDNNVILSQAMMNTQQDTGDPLFIMLSRQNGLLDADTLYLGGDVAFTPSWNIISGTKRVNDNVINNYYSEYYFLSTLGDWTSVMGELSLYTTDGQWSVAPGAVYLMLGNLDKFPVFSYAALSTVNYGNFDIVGNFLPTMTRLFFMQEGGNVNITYDKDSYHANIAFLAPSNNSFLQVSNAYTGSTKLGVSVNTKYTYDMETVGNYWYVGGAYSNLTGFANKNNQSVGAFDMNMGFNISKFEFIGEFVLTDGKVAQLTNTSSAFGLREGFAAQIMPNISNQNNFLSANSQIFSWSTQVDYAANISNKSFVPYVSYSQIQQSSDKSTSAHARSN